MINTTACVATIVEPTGVPASMDMMIPERAHVTDRTADKMVTFMKLLKSLIAESAGKIIRAEISSEPTRFIARTIITAITVAMSRL